MYASVVGLLILGLTTGIIAWLAAASGRRAAARRVKNEPLFRPEDNTFEAADGTPVTFPSTFDPSACTKTLSVVVPAYMEEKRLAVMMDETMSELQRMAKSDGAFTYEVIVVDDGSRDGTYREALQYVKRHGADMVRVLRLSRNRGKGGAVRRGMMFCRGRYILMADADGATRFSDVERLLQAARELKSDSFVVVGSRAHLEESSVATRKLHRTILMYGFHLMVRVLCVEGVRDTQCGFKLFSRTAAQILFPNLHVERWAFDVELLYLAQALGIPVREVAVTWHEVDGSKLSPLRDAIQMAKDMMRIRFFYLVGLWGFNAEVAQRYTS